MDDFLKSPDEIAIDRRKQLLTVGAIFTIALLGVAAFFAWQIWKPLPQLDECRERGFAAGTELGGHTVCLDKCATNDIATCRKSLILP